MIITFTVTRFHPCRVHRSMHHSEADGQAARIPL
jgi:hypothetical protein